MMSLDGARMDRKIELLVATYDLLQAMDERPYDRITVHYDGADCDASGLMMDIEDCLREYGIEIKENKS